MSATPDYDDASEIDLARAQTILSQQRSALEDASLTAWVADEQEIRDLRHLQAVGAWEHLEKLGPAASPRVELARQAALCSLEAVRAETAANRYRRVA